MTSLRSISQKGVVCVDVPPEPTHGHETRYAHGKSRSKSNSSFVDALEPRMAILETSLSATQDTIKGLEEKVDSLKGEYADFTIATKALIQDQANTFRGEFQAFHEELLKLCSFI